MRYFPDFVTIDDSMDEPLVIHRHGEGSSPALIVFLHGLGGSRYGTWTPKRQHPAKASLPKFLHQDIAGLDIGLYAYRTAFGRLRWWQSIDLDDEARVLADLIRDNAGTYRTIVLAGHSMGGILARAAVRELIDRNDRATLAAVRGLLLLATPQAGSQRVPGLVSWLTADTRALRPHGPLVVRIQQVFTDRVVSEPTQAKADQFVIPAYVVVAAEDNWVDRFSAGLQIPSDRIFNVRGSHTSAVKPRTRLDDAYVWVRSKVEQIVAASVAADQTTRLLPSRQAFIDDIVGALESVFTYEELAACSFKHLGRRLETIVAGQTTQMTRRLVEWSVVNPRWERGLIRMMLEERPDSARAASLARSYPEYGPLLTLAEREQLKQCLQQCIPDYAALRAFAAQKLALELDVIVGETPHAAPVARCLEFVVRRADHLDQLEPLIESALALFPGPLLEGKARPLLEAVRSRRGCMPVAEDNPFEACDLRGKLFINRIPLRNALRDLTADDGATRVIAVQGPSRSGKSHSVYLIEHIELLGKYDKAVVRLEQDEPPATFSPTLLVESLLDLISGDTTRIPEKTVDLTETRWVRRLADHVVGQIRARPRNVLIVLDGFAHPSLPAATRELVRELVKRADREPKLRVALLDYSDDLLSPEASGRYVTEPIGGFTEADLRRFFKAYARAQGDQNPPPNAIDAIVESVLAAVPARDPERNEKVAREVEAWTRLLKAPQ